VLVERVEALARPKEWRRAYDEINAFEKMLVDDGIRLVKLLAKGITLGPPALDPEVIRAAKEILGQQEIALLGLPAPKRVER
jgi:hypothetical protein